jgi:hypothetical protein
MKCDHKLCHTQKKYTLTKIWDQYWNSEVSNVKPRPISLLTNYYFYEAFQVSSRVKLLKCTDVLRNTMSPIFRVLGGDWRPGIMWASIYT